MRVAWDMQAVTGPKPTGLGVAAAMLQRAVEEHVPEMEIVGMRPNLRNKPLRGVLDRLSWEQVRLPRGIIKEEESARIDLFFSPALGVPLRCPVPKVAYVHDLIQLHYPQQFSGVAGWYWKELLPQTWRSCDALVVSNATVADDLVRFIGFPRGRIFLAPYPCEPEFAQLAAAQKLEEIGPPYFVTLGTLEPRKNIEQSINALALLCRKPQYKNVQLHVLGMHTEHERKLRTLAGRLGIAGSVRFLTDYIPKEQVASELLGARALLSMSRYEGFGLPPLEALSIGCPVVLAETPVHRAVYDDPARAAGTSWQPAFVKLDDSAALAEVMQRSIEDDVWREQQAVAGKAYAGTFTPVATAAGLTQALNAVVR